MRRDKMEIALKLIFIALLLLAIYFNPAGKMINQNLNLINMEDYQGLERCSKYA
jgi:hypothetical protein